MITYNLISPQQLFVEVIFAYVTNQKKCEHL